MKKTSFVVFISSIGTIFEWYDFTIFAYMSGVMSKLFFPSSDKRVSLLLFFAVFMIAYIVRPLGGLVFGYIGDRYGRKTSLLITLSVMAVATFLIGILPTYSKIGIFAPLAILGLRMMQGISVGGEVIGATTFIMEKFEDKKSFLTSIIWASSGIGILLASLASTCLSVTLEQDQLSDFGWRLPFLFGALIGIVGVILRGYIAESDKYFISKKENKVRKPFIKSLLSKKGQVFITFCLYVLCANITYILFVYMPDFVSTTHMFDHGIASYVNTFALAVMVMLVPLFGYLGDIYNPKKLLSFFSLSLCCLSYPLFKLMSFGMYGFVISQITFAFLSAGYQGLITSYVLSKLDIETRYLVGAMGYNLSYVFFGAGSLLLISTTIDSSWYSITPPTILCLGAMISFMSVRAKQKV